MPRRGHILGGYAHTKTEFSKNGDTTGSEVFISNGSTTHEIVVVGFDAIAAGASGSLVIETPGGVQKGQRIYPGTGQDGWANGDGVRMGVGNDVKIRSTNMLGDWDASIHSRVEAVGSHFREGAEA